MQYKSQDPSGQIENGSKIQSFFIIQRKKKAPVKGPKFIVEGCYLGCVIGLDNHVIKRIVVSLHKASEAGARPILILCSNIHDGKPIMVLRLFKHFTSDVYICDVMER